jgi:hypothetical protein
MMVLQALLYLSCILHLGTHKELVLRGLIQGVQEDIRVSHTCHGLSGP